MKLWDKIMSSIGGFIQRHAKLVLGLGLLLALASVFFAGRIKAKTQIKDMLAEGKPRVEAFDDLSEDFGGTSLIITLEGGTKRRMAAAAEELRAKIAATPGLSAYIRSMNLTLDEDFILDWGLLLQKPEDVRRMRDLFDETGILPLVEAINDNLESSYTGDEAEEDLETGAQEREAAASLSQIGNFAESLREAIEAPEGDDAGERAASLADAMIFGDLYAFSPDGRMLLFPIAMNFDIASNFESCDAIIAELKGLFVSMRMDYPEIEFGYSGDIGIQADENAAMGSDMLIPSLIAFAAVLALFAFSFKQLRSIVFAMACLGMGILLNFGVIGATIAQLNLVTSMISALLIGMGIDYGIQVTTSFAAFREEGCDAKESLRLVFAKSGFGIVLAAATTSASFFALIACASKAMKELGFVAGIGIICCLAAMIFVLPALIVLFGKRKEGGFSLPQIDYSFLERIGAFAARRRVAVLAVTAVAAAGLLFAAFFIRAEYDMMELEPQNAVSIKTYRKIVDAFEMNPNAALVVAESVDEARSLAVRFERLPSVSEVQSVSALLPAREVQAESLKEIALFRSDPPRDGAMVYGAGDVRSLAEEIQRLEWNIIELGDISVAGLGEGNKIARKRDSMIREILGAESGKPGDEVFKKLIAVLSADPERAAVRLTALDAPFSGAARKRISRMALVDRFIGPEALPRSIAEEYFDSTGRRNLVTVYPKASATSSGEGLKKFDAAMTDISPKATGGTAMMLEFFKEMLGESRKAALLVGALVLIFAFLSFKNLRFTLIAVVPPVLSLVMLFGTLSLIGWKMSAMNLITLPLNIGIGVAYGTYLLQRYLVEGRDLRAALKYTMKAIFLSAFTTMIGFGSLGLAGSFKIIAGFGVVLFIGIGYCFLTTIIVVPALLGDKGGASKNAGMQPAITQSKERSGT